MLIQGTKYKKNDRLTILLYGDNRVGKTYSTMEMIKEFKNHKVFFLSFDGGINAIIDRFTDVKDRIMIAQPKCYQELINDLNEIASIIKKKEDKSNYWIIFDTVTHLQTMLFNEARNIHIANNKNADMMFKLMNTQLDYGINLSIMTDVNKTILDLNTNVLYVATAKQDEYGNISPSIVGQSNTRITGDVDVILYMRKELDIEKNIEKRVILTGGGNYIAGDRYGQLPAKLNSLTEAIKILRKE